MYVFKLINKKSKLILLTAVVFIVCSSFISIIIPLKLKELINSPLGKDQIISFGIPVLLLLLFNIFIQSIATFLFLMEGAKIVRNLRSILVKNVIYAPISFFRNKNNANIVSHIISDTGAIGSFISDTLPLFFSNGIVFLGSLILLFVLNFKGTVLLLICFVLPISAVFFISRGLAPLAKYIQEQIANLSSNLIEVVDRIDLIKINNSQKIETDTIQNLINELYSKKVSQAKRVSFVNPIMSMGAILAIIAELLYCIVAIQQKSLSLGSAIAYFIYLFQIISPISSIGSIITSIITIKGTLSHITAIYNQVNENINYGTELESTSIHKIELKDISYQYENKIILDNINISAIRGQMVALVGPSGAGKSTILNIMATLYSPTTGLLLVNNENRDSLKLKCIRNRISYAFQENKLIRGTIEDNIIYNSKYNQYNLDLLKNSGLLNFANDWKTYFLDMKKHFSGGELQRISLSRALYKNSDLLLLDEITANLDADSEKEVDQLLKKMQPQKIIFVAAHRLSTIVHADKIYFIDSGMITGSGTHEELYKKHKKYKNFVDTQII